MENSDNPNSVTPNQQSGSIDFPTADFVSDPPGNQPHETSNSTDSADPQISDDNFQSFDPRNITAERVAGGIFAGIVGVALVIGACVLYSLMGAGWILLAAIIAAFLCFSVFIYFTIFWPAIEHRHRQWRLTDVGLEVRNGVWWKHMQAIPWARVQHADVSQGPIQRAYGVGTLTLHTAGTSNSSVNLGGLSHEVAIGLRDKIIRQRASGDVV